MTAPNAAEARAARKEATRLERRLARLDAREAELLNALAAAAADYQQVTTLDAELRAVRGERESAEDTWLELSEHL